MKITDVGGTRSSFSDKVASCMLRSLCEATPSEAEDPFAEAVETESIFGPGSKMGLDAKGDSDRWQYDANNASWTRFIVVPRTSFFILVKGRPKKKEALVPDYRISETIVGLWRTADSGGRHSPHQG